VAKEFMDIFKAMWVGMTVLAGTAAQVANYMDTESGTNFAKEFMLIADMKDNLGNVILKYQGGIATMVRNIQKDSEKFLKLCSAGGFSQVLIVSF
jgi:hypothetical protein